MKRLLVVSLLPVFAFAQNVGVKVDGVDANENTTIEIRKGDKAKPSEKLYEITEGTDDVLGDPAPILQDARKNWKKACDAWKNELKDLNKENQVLTMNCGSMSCATVTMESTCKSTAKYKLKVKIN